MEDQRRANTQESVPVWFVAIVLRQKRLKKKNEKKIKSAHICNFEI